MHENHIMCGSPV